MPSRSGCYFTDLARQHPHVGYDRAFTIAAVLSLAGLICSILIPTAAAAPTALDQSGRPRANRNDAG